ncbi:MAG TPA: hypothetical protein VHD31_03000 [Candidatus Paceibacterota bacterium]|nr:hypothetical protein [Candidatus Paceibacterota bacterium]
MKTWLPIIVVFLALIAGGAFLGWRTATAPIAQEKTYSSQTAGVAFTYPKTYILGERADSFEGSPITVLTLLPTDVAVPDMSEGPPGISVLVVPNPENIPLEDWVRTKSISNIGLSMDLSLGSTTVAGESAVAYKFPGLYENDAVAVAHAGRVYLFFGSWSDANAPIRSDFQNLLKTVTFK